MSEERRWGVMHYCPYCREECRCKDHDDKDNRTCGCMAYPYDPPENRGYSDD